MQVNSKKQIKIWLALNWKVLITFFIVGLVLLLVIFLTVEQALSTSEEIKGEVISIAVLNSNKGNEYSIRFKEANAIYSLVVLDASNLKVGCQTVFSKQESKLLRQVSFSLVYGYDYKLDCR